MIAAPPGSHDDGFSGLALHDHLPLRWEPSPLEDPAEVELCNLETARALQALAVFEEMPRELPNDTTHMHQELAHIEAKIDVLLSLVTRLARERQGVPQPHATVLHADGIEWSGPEVERTRNGDTGILILYPNPAMPLPFRLPSRIVGSAERNGTRWRRLHFEQLSSTVSVGIEKLVFRRHRRQVALSRGTDVFSRTGIHRAPKF